MAFRGGQQQVLHLAMGLARVGVEQHLVLRRGSAFEQRAAEANLPLTTLPFRSESDLASALQLRKLIARFNPEIVHAHDARTLGLSALTWAMGTRSRIIAARRVAFPLRRNPLTAVKYRSVARRIVAVSKYVRELLVASGVEERRIDVVYDGFDLNRVVQRSDSRKSLGVAANDCLIGCAGHFVAEKGHESLIHAFARISQVMPDATLVLIGDGELRDKYRLLVQQLNLEGKVIFPGFVPDLAVGTARVGCICVSLSPGRPGIEPPDCNDLRGSHLRKPNGRHPRDRSGWRHGILVQPWRCCIRSRRVCWAHSSHRREAVIWQMQRPRLSCRGFQSRGWLKRPVKSTLMSCKRDFDEWVEPRLKAS